MTTYKWLPIKLDDGYSYDLYKEKDGGGTPTGYWIDVGQRNVWLSTPQGETIRFETVDEAKAEGIRRAKEEGR